MKKLTVFWVLVFTLYSVCIPFGVLADSVECDTAWFDIEESEFHINSVAQLIGLRQIVNTGESDFYDKTVYLDSDIDMSGISWYVGIGYISTSTSADEQKQFNGTFDGDGHVILNFNYNSNGEDSYSEVKAPVLEKHRAHGLFGYVGKNGIIKNVKLENPTVEAGTKNLNLSKLAVGSMAGINYGTIDSCIFKNVVLKGGYWGSFTNQYYGGAVGANYGGISNCFLNGLDFLDVVAQINATYKGGICYNPSAENGTVKNCYTCNLVYDKSDGYYQWDENGNGKSKITKMFYFDPVVYGGKDRIVNAWSDDSYFKNSHSDPRTYTDFHVLTDDMKNIMLDLSFDDIKALSFDISNTSPYDGEIEVDCMPVIKLAFDGKVSSSSVDNDSVVIKDENEVKASVKSITSLYDGFEIKLASPLNYNTEYTLSYDGLKDMWNRNIESSSISFRTQPEVICSSFELYKNYSSSPVKINSLNDVSGKVTAVIKGLKNNGANAYSAVLVIAYIEDGTFKDGNYKVVSIPGNSAVDGTITLELDMSSGVSLTKPLTNLHAVLYKDFDNAVPLIVSSLAE